MRRDKKKKKKSIGKFILVLIVILMTVLGAYLGYSISKNGGGLQGVLATVLGQDMEDLENLDTIHVLVLRNKRRSRFKINRHDHGMFLQS